MMIHCMGLIQTKMLKPISTLVRKKEKKKGKKKKNKSKASTKCEEVSEHELGKNAISHETESEHFQTANLKN